jgi:CSLREA domain-containing protein
MYPDTHLRASKTLQRSPLQSLMSTQQRGPFQPGAALRLALVAVWLALLLPVPGLVPAVQAATFTVTTNADGTDASPGDGVCETAPGNGVCTLRAAIEEANANVFGSHDTIHLPANTYTLSVGSNVPPDGTKDLDIRESLTILGEGAETTIIDGGSGPMYDRVFEIAPFGGHVPEVVISGVTIQNGSTGQGGGGIYNYGCTVMIADSTLSSNWATFGGGMSNNGNGGAIYNNGGSVTIQGSTLVDNQSRGVVVTAVAGGAIYNTGGGTLHLIDSVLSDNQVSTIAGSGAAAQGGAVYNASGGMVTAQNTNFLRNNATGIGGIVGDGGGIYNDGGTLTLTEGSILGGNSADFKGGGIHNQAGTLTFDDGYLGCLANTATLGGGLSNDGGTVELTDITLCSGRAEPATGSGMGGGIYNIGGGSVTIQRSRLMSNVAAGSIGYGGGIFNAGNSSQIHLLDSSLSASQASGNSGYGGGIFNTGGGAVHIEGSLISYNWVQETGGSALAGGILNGGSTSVMTVTNSTISGNEAGDSGGGVYNSYATLTMQYVTLSHNTADSDADGTGDGGGIFQSNGTVSLQNTIIAANSDDSPGTQYADCSGILNSQDYNLIQATAGCTVGGATAHNVIGRPPNLGPVSGNGGPTATRALLTGSPAINAGLCIAETGVDQRGWLRPGVGDPRCDIGAYEVGAGIPTYLPLMLRDAGL